MAVRFIAVIGATGMLGRPVTEELLRAGFAVRIIARDLNKARALFPQADVVGGDLRDAPSLRAALTGVEAVYLNLSVLQTEKPADFHTETDGLATLLAVAQEVGLRRVAYLSSLVMRYQGTNGFRWWVFEVKHEAVRLIKASDLPYSIFYPSCFMESLLYTQRQGQRVLLAGDSPVQPYYVAGHDYGRQVARALQRAEATENQEYVVQGPEPMTQTAAARQFVQHYTRERLRVSMAPHWVMRLAGLFSQQLHYGAHITEALNKYPEVFMAAQTWHDLGRPETTVPRFAEQASQS